MPSFWKTAPSSINVATFLLLFDIVNAQINVSSTTNTSTSTDVKAGGIIMSPATTGILSAIVLAAFLAVCYHLCKPAVLQPLHPVPPFVPRQVVTDNNDISQLSINTASSHTVPQP